MKRSLEEYRAMCDEAYELLSSIQADDNTVYNSPLDKSLSDAMDNLLNVVDGKKGR